MSPDETRALEGLIQQADQQAAAAPGLLRLRVERARDLAIRMLRAARAEATEEERLEVARLIRVEAAGEQWTDDREPKSATERRHKRAKDLAAAVALGWLGHPAVAKEVGTARSALRALVEPLGMVDQLTVTQATARLLDCSAYWPDGTEWPNPFEGAPEALLQEATRIQPLFVEALQQTATRIAAAGAPLDPADPGVLLVLAQLTLLDVDLGLAPAVLVDDLNIWPPGWIDREAARQGHVATHSSLHGRTVRFQADLASGAEFLAKLLGPPAIRPRYSGGRTRRTRRDTQELRRALEALVRRYPGLTPATLLELVSGKDHPGLDDLRMALGWTSDHMPDQQRLQRNWPESPH